jgi:hypothetical protein
MLIYFLGLSASRKSSWATTSIATESSTGPVMKMMRSLSNRD